MGSARCGAPRVARAGFPRRGDAHGTAPSASGQPRCFGAAQVSVPRGSPIGAGRLQDLSSLGDLARRGCLLTPSRSQPAWHRGSQGDQPDPSSVGGRWGWLLAPASRRAVPRMPQGSEAAQLHRFGQEVPERGRAVSGSWAGLFRVRSHCTALENRPRRSPGTPRASKPSHTRTACPRGLADTLRLAQPWVAAQRVTCPLASL